MSIALVDTTVFCNILPVPGMDQNHAVIKEQLEMHIKDHVTLLLPVATILETGNHVAHLGDGSRRRQTAERFVSRVREALDADSAAPWTISRPLLDPDELGRYLSEFPDHAMRGLTLGDLSIIKEFERQCELHHARRVFIWSLDQHLGAYDRPPKI